MKTTKLRTKKQHDKSCIYFISGYDRPQKFYIKNLTMIETFLGFSATEKHIRFSPFIKAQHYVVKTSGEKPLPSALRCNLQTKRTKHHAYLPTNMVYSMTPNDHMSAAFPE